MGASPPSTEPSPALRTGAWWDEFGTKYEADEATRNAPNTPTAKARHASLRRWWSSLGEAYDSEEAKLRLTARVTHLSVAEEAVQKAIGSSPAICVSCRAPL